MKYLTYHSIGKDNGEIGAGLYCVAEHEFRKQMEYIAKHTETVSCESGNCFCVTFDDGDSTNFTAAYPILKDMSLKAYFFIIGGRIGAEGYMNLEQIKELARAGMIVGSHGMTHRILAGLNDKELDFEIKDSKKLLEDNLGFKVEYFSVPRGFYTEKIIEKARETGYKKVFTSNAKDNDEFKAGRISVKRNWNEAYFIRVIENGLGMGDRIKEGVKESAKRILGAGKYDKIRTMILK